MNSPAKRALKIHEQLLDFYGEPVWRNPLPAIDELVSTILSQNTNDINRDRAFEACANGLAHGRKCGMRTRWMS
jgi:endonuclease III-like uncharacterized protein